jgi:hypothetical protein
MRKWADVWRRLVVIHFLTMSLPSSFHLTAYYGQGATKGIFIISACPNMLKGEMRRKLEKES